MRARKAFTHVGLAIAGAAVLSVAVVAPAGAHTDSLFTAVYLPDGNINTGQFATISKTDASLTPFGADVPADVRFNAIEIYDETGYAVGTQDGVYPVIVTWDHSTGTTGTPIVVHMPQEGTVYRIWGLDTVVNGDLPDGTLLVRAEVRDDEDNASQWVGSVDPVTGVFTPLVELSGQGVPLYVDSLATDPTTGITYALADESDGMPQFLTLDLVAGTWTGPIDLTEIAESLGEGFMWGTDFDASGSLWFYYNVFETDADPLARTVGAFGADVSAVSSGLIPFADGTTLLVGALTVDPAGTTPPADPEPAAPTLPATGTSADVGMLGAVVLLVFGTIAVVIARRRSVTA